jgi:hypothetical protein
VFHWFPGILVIGEAYPFDIIRHDAIHMFAIGNDLRLIYFFAIHLYRLRQSGSALPVQFVWLMEGHMNSIMDLPYSYPKIQSIGLQAYSSYDLKRAVVHVVQLVARPSCAEAFSRQPYSVAHGILSGPCLVVCLLSL